MWIILLAIPFILFGLVAFVGAPYVPSHRKYVREAFAKLYKLSDKDLVVDLGSGDGVVMRVAREFDAKCVGYELNLLLAFISKVLARGDKGQKVVVGDMWTAKLPEDVTLFYAFSVSRDVNKLMDRVQRYADTSERTVKLMTYGPVLKLKKPSRTQGAHSLYVFVPKTLQSRQA
ncbi:hypothetical protein KC949_00365 [Candidatus Saccharibacteria bacterium]|nr:hypothetical protein [Candidatus Saccharibacteria bacterium]